jgi:hypothetical protein
MIDQDFSDVHILGIPKFKTLASELLWACFSSEGMINWQGGRLKVINDEPTDSPGGGEAYLEFSTKGIPSVYLDMLVSIDIGIPPVEDIIDEIDPHSLGLSLESAAFSLSAKANINDLAVCVLASRIAMEVFAFLTLPEGMTSEEAMQAIQTVGLNAFYIGGLEVYTEVQRLIEELELWELRDIEEDYQDFAEMEQDEQA